MGASSREFLLMRQEEETGQLYVPTISKKEVKSKAEQDAQALIDAGNADVADAFVDATRIAEYLTTFVKALKIHVTPDEYGKEYATKSAKITFRGTGDRLDYEQDEVYANLKQQLKEREELLKLAYKSKDMLFDSEGVEVPKVAVKTPSKETVVITY